MTNHIQATVTEELVQQLPLVEIAERIVINDEALNIVCDKMLDAVSRILQRDLNQDDAWAKAEAELSAEQRLAVWHEAITSIS